MLYVESFRVVHFCVHEIMVNGSSLFDENKKSNTTDFCLEQHCRVNHRPYQ